MPNGWAACPARPTKRSRGPKPASSSCAPDEMRPPTPPRPLSTRSATRAPHPAADLRPHLVAGQPGPVCDQRVAVGPAPLDAGAIEKAQDRLDQAVSAAEAARGRAAAATAAEAKATSGLDALNSQR